MFTHLLSPYLSNMTYDFPTRAFFPQSVCLGGGDSSVVRAPDSWLKGRGFESLLERRENFLLQGRLSVLTLISVSVSTPVFTTVARKKIPVILPKSAGGRLQLNTHTPYVCGIFIEPCFGIGHNLSLICQMTSEDIKHQLIIIGLSMWAGFGLAVRR